MNKYLQPNCSNPLYNSWHDMKRRCLNPNRKDFMWYGGRGIEVCDKWLKFAGFAEDMLGTYFTGATIDRIDNNKGYCKENCQWSTKSKQQQNRSNNSGHWKHKKEVDAMHKKGATYKEIASHFGMSVSTVYNILIGNIPGDC